MIRFTLSVCALLFTLLSLTPAHASILFEPYLGYSLGHVDKTFGTALAASAGEGAKDGGSISGIGYGGRLGFLVDHFGILAGEFQGINAKEKMDKLDTGNNWNQTAVFIDMGFQTFMGLRMMVGYAPTVNHTEVLTPSPTKFKGEAYKGTVGWITPADIAINVEYTYYKMTDQIQDGVTTKVKDSYDKYSYSAVMATLSFPITFFGGSHGR